MSGNTLKLSVLVIILMILPVISYSQRDRRQIMFNQARRMEARRDFDSAIDIYQDLIKEYPQDNAIAEAYFNVLMNLNRHEEAEEFLDTHQQAFKIEDWIQFKITLYGQKGEFRQAERIGLDFIKENPGMVNLYKDFALAYERINQYDTAIEILQMARTQTGDENLFASELGRMYQANNQFSPALDEYIKHLSRNTGFLYMVADRINSMIDQEESLVSEVIGELEDKEEPVLLELLAMTLVHSELYDDAYTVYQQLGLDKLVEFADELTAAGHVGLAVRAYEEYYNEIDNPVRKAEVKVKVASIHITSGDYEQAEETLLMLTEKESIQRRDYRYRSHVNRIVREMLADLSIRNDQPKDTVLGWLDDAKNFAFNRNEQREIDLKKVRYLIMSEDYDQAEGTIETTVAAESSGSRVYNISYYYRYLHNLMVNQTSSDSLMAELIIRIPDTELTNEALFLAVMMGQINPQNGDIFLEAYRLKNLYKANQAVSKILRNTSEAIDSLYTDRDLGYDNSIIAEPDIAERIKDGRIEFRDEELVLTAAIWSYHSGKTEIAQTLLSYPYQNSSLAGYAALKLSDIQKNRDQPYRQAVTSFLQDNPQNVFAPQLRLMLTE